MHLTIRTFAVSTDGTVLVLTPEQHLTLMGVTRAMADAVDVLLADRVTPEKAVMVAHAAERDGRDPVAAAHHFVMLRRTLRGA
ncbi:hypothetical protein [Saccharothrix australiensis]|uniref:Uncharacterized protein n=1 Tax=Saccharothrix australiensis TaxID=2072 RepID=A0A495VK70_9PSEU|nr:hypothetical protein [Saccharothrix australiensis]RKT49300.1 hypothetical protein C8E97_6796 [Saccharothrix australiensis]